MKKQKILLMLLATLGLSSCGFMNGLPDAGIQARTVQIPANLAADCEAPVTLADDSMGAMGDALADNTAALVDCGKRHKKAVDWWRGDNAEK